MSPDQSALHPGERVRIRDQQWRVTRYRPYLPSAVLEVAGDELSNRGTRSAFLLPWERVDRIPSSAAQPRVISFHAWRRVARRTLAESSPHWNSLRTARAASFTIMPFQLEPALALTAGRGCRFLIADDVGLGKTVQAGLMLAELFARNADARAVVVSPAGLRDQWCEELQRRFDLEARVFDSAAVARLASQLPNHVNPWAVHPLVITSVDYIKRPEVMRSLEALIWDAIVFDEAHALTGRSDRASAAAALAGRGRHVVMLTATPHSGDDEEFRRLCEIGSLGGSCPLLMFRRTRADVGTSAARRVSWLRVRPSAAEAAMHAALSDYARLVWRQTPDAPMSHARLAMIVLGRRACSSATSLARSIHRRLTLLAAAVPAPEQLALPLLSASGDEEPDADLATPGLPDQLDERRRLEQILALALEAAAAESKVAVLTRLVRRARQPMIVFTEYRDTLERLALALGTVEISRLHGGLSPVERAGAITHFTSGSAQLLLATDAAGEGLNLHQRCRVVVNLELPWTPLRLEQRIGRVDRLGQPRRVHAVHLVAAGTNEERVLAKLARRADRARATLSFTPRTVREVEVADSIFGDRPVPPASSHEKDPLPSNISRPDLRDEAEREAARIVCARRLSRELAGMISTRRPVVAARRDWRRPRASRVWAFRLMVEDPDGRVVWETLVGLELPILRGANPTARDLRSRLSLSLPLLADPLVELKRARLRDHRRQLAPFLDLMRERERTIVKRLQHQHARLAADMVQHGLFDRRTERAAAGRAALLETSLSQASGRLRLLDCLEAARFIGHEPVFAIELA